MKNILFSLVIVLNLHAQDFNITKFGAKAGEGIDNTQAVQKAIDEASKVGGTVVFPFGKFATSTIHLKSNITVYLSRGAVWTEVTGLEKFEKYRASVRSRCDIFSQTNFILAMDAENITIDGEGTIDGNGRRKEIQDRKFDELGTLRPWGVHFINCKNIKVRNVLLTNSSYWMMRFFNCDKVLVDGVRVFNHGTVNSDGMDIDCCHDVRISNCDIDASDDGLCFKSEGLRPCEDAVVTNCIVRSHASAIKFGTGSMGGFKRIAVSNCIVHPSKSPEIVHMAKCWRGMVGLEIHSVDGGIVEDFAISNLIIDSSETPIHIKLGNRFDRHWEGGGKAEKSILRNILMDNIIVKNAGPVSSAITGYPGNYIENVVITNLSYEAEGSGKISDTNMKVMENASSYPINRMYNSNLPSYGLYVRHVKGIYMNNVQFFTKGQDARSAIVMDDVMDGKVDVLKAENKSQTQPFITLADASDIHIFGDGGINDLKQFVRIKNDSCKNTLFFNSRFKELNFPVTVKNFVVKPMCKNVSYAHADWSEGVANTGGVYEYVVLRNGQPLCRTRNLSFNDYNIKENTKYNYELISYNAQGKEDMHKSVTIQTVQDIDKPKLQSWRLVDNQNIELVFSEPMDDKTCNDISNYVFNSEIKINGIGMSDKGNTIILNTAPLKSGIAYSLQVKGMKDKGKKGNTIDPLKLDFTDNPLAASFSFDDGNTDGIKGKGLHPEKGKPLGIPNATSLNFEGNMAISVWFKLDDPAANKYYRILSKRKQWDEAAGYELEMNPFEHRFNFCGGATSTDMQGTIRFDGFDNQWHHLVAMIKDSKAVYYMDGKKISQDDMVALPVPNTQDLFIGCSPNGGDLFEGIIDELKLFNRSLNSNEIAELAKK